MTEMDYSKYEIKFENGETLYIPTWFWDLPDEELDKIRQTIIDGYKTPSPQPESSNTYEEIESETEDLYRQLREEGFTFSEAEEIIAYIGCGYSVDAAIQTVLTK